MVKYPQFHARGSNNSKKFSKFSFILIGLLACSILSQTMVDGKIFIQHSESQSQLIHPMASTLQSDPIEPIAREDELLNALGEIEIIDINLFESLTHSNYVVNSTNITYSVSGDNADTQTLFRGTIENASTANAEGSIAANRRSNIIIQFFTEIEWTYNSSVAANEEKTVGFRPIVQPALLSKMEINGTEVTNSSKYFSESYLGKSIFYYDFQEEFQDNSNGSFSIRYYYDVNVPISAWGVITPWEGIMDEEGNLVGGDSLYIENLTSVVSQYFQYSVTIGGSATLPFNAEFEITFPNKEDIYDLSIDNINNLNATDYAFVLEDNVLEFSIDSTKINLSQSIHVEAGFYADYTVEFLEVIEGFWCEDRLVSGTDHRERDYKWTISDGPDDLMLVYFGFNETTIYFDHLYGSSLRSALGRDTSRSDMNISDSIYDPAIIAQTIFVDGVELLLASQLNPYLLFKGEVDIITIQYIAVKDLKFVVTDSIKTPIADVQVNIYINDVPYGTLLSSFENYPIAPKTTDYQGQVIIRDVPIGNFTIEILDDQGTPLQNLTANSLNEYDDNLVITNKTHFPTIILYFGGISAVMIVFGIFKFKNQK